MKIGRLLLVHALLAVVGCSGDYTDRDLGWNGQLDESETSYTVPAFTVQIVDPDRLFDLCGSNAGCVRINVQGQATAIFARPDAGKFKPDISSIEGDARWAAACHEVVGHVVLGYSHE